VLPFSSFGLNIARKSLLIVAILALSACATRQNPTGIDDPFELRNRQTHKFNKSLDRAVLKPISKAYGSAANGPLSRGIDNFASNISLPGTVLNDLLQLQLGDAFGNTARFAMNSVIGLGGLFDVATPNGLTEQSTDFGETLYIWGVPEGHFVELPILGPSTGRDAVGTLVDFLIDPTNLIPKPQGYVGTLSRVLNKVSSRSKFAGTIESILYESEDSYAQSRLIYLQSRRHQLSGTLNEDDLEDPYAE